MRLGRVGWQVVYELLAVRSRRPEWAFMNYGLVLPDGDPAPRLAPGDEPDRLAVQVYARTVGPEPLAGREVLEVGSGRGGGSLWVAREHRPRRTVGLDLSAAAVDLSRRHRRAPGLSFVRGSADALPFPDAAFDAVLNVESSHCYPDLPAFLAQVRRVLRPGGALLLADFRPADEVPALLAAVRAAGLVVEDEEDVTAGVVAALDADDARKRALLTAWLGRAARPLLARFAALRGSSSYEGFRSGRTRYVVVRARVPGAGGAPHTGR
ncbi:class I SAM-dependent methyltransferase [Cellulomonas endophytica]|uniref:class I SAM-dependent methyltransferase n=1 Tax=Cellulomonas endophytica TaxID=2494735 RepID=UPI00196BAF9C|nr:class I SAM-dependent methyltransferase [Cellulomonas endophytica]